LFNDRGVFFPADGSNTVRVSASPRGATAPAAPPDAEPGDDDNPEAPVDGGVTDSTPAPGAPAAAGGTRPTRVSAALTPAEAQAVVAQAQTFAAASSGAGLNPQQAAALQSLVSVPGQQLVGVGALPPAVVSCFIQSDGTAVVNFANGSVLVLGPQGNVISQVYAGSFAAGLTLEPWLMALFITTAVLSIGLAVLLLVAGILMLGRSPSGRRLHLVYACLKIPAALAGGFAIARVMYELTGGPSGGTQQSGAARGAASLLMAFVPTLLGCIYPVVLLAVLNTKAVRDHFRSIAPAG
jgi:hypothetical protein